jgi:hypothetical protein
MGQRCQWKGGAGKVGGAMRTGSSCEQLWFSAPGISFGGREVSPTMIFTWGKGDTEEALLRVLPS